MESLDLDPDMDPHFFEPLDLDPDPHPHQDPRFFFCFFDVKKNLALIKMKPGSGSANFSHPESESASAKISKLGSGSLIRTELTGLWAGGGAGGRAEPGLPRLPHPLPQHRGRRGLCITRPLRSSDLGHGSVMSSCLSSSVIKAGM